MALCISQYPYFAFKSENEAFNPKIPSKLGTGVRPADGIIWLTRSTPKNRNEWTNKPIPENSVLIGYHLKRLVEYGQNDASPDTVLFIKNRDEFNMFQKMYGIKGSTNIDWDKVKEQWGGLEMRAAYLPSWEPYRVAIWNVDALEDVEVCPQSVGNDNPIFITYGLSYCPYSLDVVNTLEQLNIPHKNHFIKEHEKDYYKDLHKWPTFPQVFLVGKDGNLHLVGGSNDFHALLRSIAD